MGLKIVLLVTFREIACIRRKDVLSRVLAVAGEGAHFAITDDNVKFLEMGFIRVIFRVKIEVLPLVATSFVKRVARRRGWVAVRDSRWTVENRAGASPTTSSAREKKCDIDIVGEGVAELLRLFD